MYNISEKYKCLRLRPFYNLKLVYVIFTFYHKIEMVTLGQQLGLYNIKMVGYLKNRGAVRDATGTRTLYYQNLEPEPDKPQNQTRCYNKLEDLQYTQLAINHTLEPLMRKFFVQLAETGTGTGTGMRTRTRTGRLINATQNVEMVKV